MLLLMLGVLILRRLLRRRLLLLLVIMVKCPSEKGSGNGFTQMAMMLCGCRLLRLHLLLLMCKRVSEGKSCGDHRANRDSSCFMR